MKFNLLCFEPYQTSKIFFKNGKFRFRTKKKRDKKYMKETVECLLLNYNFSHEYFFKESPFLGLCPLIFSHNRKLHVSSKTEDK